MIGSRGLAIDLGPIIPASTPLTAAMFPHLAAAVQEIAAMAQEEWVEYAMGKALPDGQVIENRTGEYARSIILRQLGDFSAEVASELPYAKQIEDGAPSRDMKKILNTSFKVRLSKDGRRYLIIPIRHDTPGSVMGNAMPKAVHDWWKQDRVSSAVTGTYMRKSGIVASDIKTRKQVVVPGWRYKWGSRLGNGDLAAMPLSEHQRKRLEGMVRFRTPGKKGGAANSQYLTFRVMVEGSKGWIAPAQPAKRPAAQTADHLRPDAEAAFEAAVTADISAILQAS